jgi:DNA-binding beta-propeller fold protein YncE
MNRKLAGAVFLAGCIGLARAADAPARVLPGLQPDGLTRLHNQWSIRPAGRQIALGDFPVNAAIDPSGRWAAVLHAGYGKHEVWLIDLATSQVLASSPLPEAFAGLAFTADGRTLVCSGGSQGVLHRFAVSAAGLVAQPDVPVVDRAEGAVVAGFALSPDGDSAMVGLAFDSRVVRVDFNGGGRRRWVTPVGRHPEPVRLRSAGDPDAPNEVLLRRDLIHSSDPLHAVWDARRSRAYVSLWGEDAVAVLAVADGRVLGRWPAGLHPNELVLSRDGRLFVANGGANTVTVIDAKTGQAIDTLCSAFLPDDPPGSTPDSLALSRDGRTLFVANAYNNTIAVFDVSSPGRGRALGFIPTGWFPTAVRLTPDGRTLAVVSARGLTPQADDSDSPVRWPRIDTLYPGSLGLVSLPTGDEFTAALAAWTITAQRCRPAADPAGAATAAPSAPAAPAAAASTSGAVATAEASASMRGAPVGAPPTSLSPTGPFGPAQNPIPVRVGLPSPIRYVVYIIKENRTYDQVLGDLPQGNGKAQLCLFPERVTPNLHALARQFVLLDNFYANAEVSASGHEWSMAGYASEFVEKSWPVNYGHKGTNVPYPAEGHFAAAVPALGYLWDRAASAGVSYRSYGEFVVNGSRPGDPATASLPALKGRIDPFYRGWDLKYRDVDRAARFLAEVRRFEALGDMPRLQIVRLPADHTAGAHLGDWTPEAMVADNDLGVGRLVEGLSRSKFWPQTAVFIVEDDAQSGPDHVDAHRTTAYVAGPYVRRGAVDSTPYTTCSMLHTIELILGIPPLSQFDAAAPPMRASFTAQPDLTPFRSLPARIDLTARNVARTAAAAQSAHFNLSREDAIDDQLFNRVIWATVRGGADPMPAPVHAAFVRTLPKGDGDEDDDDRE